MRRTYFLYDEDGNKLGSFVVEDELDLPDAQMAIAEVIAEDFAEYEENE